MHSTCAEFEARWQAHLDARTPPSAELDRALEEHAATCPSCAASAARYRTLAAALRAWGLPPTAPDGLADRVLAAWQAESRRSRSRVLPAAWRWAAAAAVLLATFIGVRTATGPRRNAPHQAASSPSVAPPEAPPLSEALAEATSATLELARASSAPVARLGRHVLASSAAPPSLQQASWTLPAVPEPAASDVLQSVGEGVNQGMRPLSGSARRAFGFLLGPAAPGPSGPPRDRDA